MIEPTRKVRSSDHHLSMFRFLQSLAHTPWPDDLTLNMLPPAWIYQHSRPQTVQK